MLFDTAIKKRLNSTTVNSPWVSLVKSVSWRLLGTLDTILISWLVTGNASFALSIGAVEVITKMLLYYLHERVWERLLLKYRKS
jgi:uncharacterized membrane protein